MPFFFYRSLGQVFVLFSQYVKAKACGARVLDMIAMKPIIPLRGGAVIPEDYFSGEIRLRNVTFAYPTRPDQNVVDHLSLNIPPGKVVALCGSSGSGKSTVAALIERLGTTPFVCALLYKIGFLIDKFDLCTKLSVTNE